MYVLLLLIFFISSISASKPYDESDIQKFLQVQRLLESTLDPRVLLQRKIPSNTACAADVDEYLHGVANKSRWALSMLDASAKLPEGLLKLNHIFLGQYEQCLEIRHNQIQGQHCLIRGQLQLKNASLEIASNVPKAFFYGLCTPSSCSPEILTEAFAIVENVTGGVLTLQAEKDNCYIDEKPTLKAEDWVVTAIMAVLGALVLLSTAYEVFQLFYASNDKPEPILSAFSLYKNSQTLFKFSKGGEKMRCLHGLRTISIAWVIIYHLLEIMPVAPVVNPLDALQMKTKPVYVLILKGYQAVDTFLVISGMLTAISFFSAIKRAGGHDAPLSWIHRYFRLTPSYAMVLLFHVTLFRYIGDGPAYNLMQKQQQEHCHKWWWTSMLYVQNYVNPDELCLTQTWYLSVDMQLQWIAPLILYPMVAMSHKVAFIFISIVSLIFTFFPFGIAYSKDLAPVVDLDTTGLQNRYDYFPTHSRMAPWLVGIGLGYFMHFFPKNQFKKLKSIHVLLGWLLATVVCLACIYGLTAFETNHNYSKFEAAFYLTFHRLGWALGISWIIFACVYGYGGFVDEILSYSPFETFGKLAYGVYLSHVSIIMYRVAVMRISAHFNTIELLLIFFQVFFVSQLIAIVLYLVVEAPFFNLERYLLRNAKILPFKRKLAVK